MHHGKDVDVICHLDHSDFDKEQIRVQMLLLGVDFYVVTANGAMIKCHLKEYPYFLSLRQDTAIANVASGRTSPVNSRHSFNECYIGELVQCPTMSPQLLAHHDDARTSELGPT